MSWPAQSLIMKNLHAKKFLNVKRKENGMILLLPYNANRKTIKGTFHSVHIS